MESGSTLWDESVTELLALISNKIEITEDIQDKAKLLDRYYISLRCSKKRPGKSFVRSRIGNPENRFGQNLFSLTDQLEATDRIKFEHSKIVPHVTNSLTTSNLWY